MYECMYGRMNVCMNVWMYECMYERMNVCMYVCMKSSSERMYACMYVYMYAQIYSCIYRIGCLCNPTFINKQNINDALPIQTPTPTHTHRNTHTQIHTHVLCQWHEKISKRRSAYPFQPLQNMYLSLLSLLSLTRFACEGPVALCCRTSSSVCGGAWDKVHVRTRRNRILVSGDLVIASV